VGNRPAGIAFRTDRHQQPPPESTRRPGSERIAHGYAVALCAPSVLITEEWDIVLNPAHPDFYKVRISKPQAFRF
jgi:RES domain-containing protein